MPNAMTEIIFKGEDGILHGPFFIEEPDFAVALLRCLKENGATMREAWARSFIGSRSRYFNAPLSIEPKEV